jgi:ATP-dependent Lhr-like helicase
MRDRTSEKRRGRPDPRAARSWRRGPPGSEGRWSLRSARFGKMPSPTERRTALARALLERYGVVTREAAHAEGIAGGFSAVYEVLKAMEDAGRVRRGYFVAERGATQFALPGADDRLRAAREPEGAPKIVVLAATDPANPYGASLAWPHVEEGSRPKPPQDGAPGSASAPPSRPKPPQDGAPGSASAPPSRPKPQRAAGAKVILRDGALLGWLGRREEALLTFLPSDEPHATTAANDLVAAVTGMITQSPSRRALLLATIDGKDASSHPLAPLFVRAGFVKKTGSAMLLRRHADTHLRLVARDA